MTSIAGFLASLAGGAPQEGQKATPANATGTIGLFSALISATGSAQIGEGEVTGEITGQTNPLGLTLGLPDPEGSPDAQANAQVTAQTAEADAVLGEALSEGLSLPSGEVEAAIVDAPVADDAGAVSAVTPGAQDAPSATPAAEITTAADENSENAGPAVPPAEEVIAGDSPDAPPPIAGETQDAAPSAPAPGTAQTATQGPQSGAPGKPDHLTGLEHALTRASEKGQQNGLQNALSQAPRARAAGEAPHTAQPEARPDAQRPAIPDASGAPGQVKPVHDRPQFATLETKPVQRVIDAGKGQTQIQIHAPTGGETASLNSPPTLTVNVPASAASPGPVSPNTPHVPVSALAVHIAQKANNGARRFDISLDPPELGRIEVRLDVSREGQVMTHLVVERSETLDLLQRDARHLERMLQDAGLNTSEDGMKFSLKDQGQAKNGGDNQGGFDEDGSVPGDHEDNADSPIPDSAMPPPKRYLASTGLDIRI